VAVIRQGGYLPAYRLAPNQRAAQSDPLNWPDDWPDDWPDG